MWRACGWRSAVRLGDFAVCQAESPARSGVRTRDLSRTKAVGRHHTEIAGAGIVGVLKSDRTNHDDIENDRSPAWSHARRPAISLLANLGKSQTIIEGLSQSPALVMIAGYAAFVPGLAIVYFHNRWTGGWPVLVTIMGWLSLVVGLLRMVFPTQIAAMATKIAPSATGLFTCHCGLVPGDRSISFVQGLQTRLTMAAICDPSQRQAGGMPGGRHRNRQGRRPRGGR
jgi:hypothetical protein